MKRSTKKRTSYNSIIAITAILALLILTSCSQQLCVDKVWYSPDNVVQNSALCQQTSTTGFNDQANAIVDANCKVLGYTRGASAGCSLSNTLTFKCANVTTSCAPLKTFDIAGSQADGSGTFMAIPNAPACTADAQCLAAVVPAGKTLDPTTTIRCNAGVCEAKWNSMTGKVTP